MNFILEKLEERICTFVINRPKQYNALNENVLIELNSKLDAIIEKNNCSAIIITGMGSKAFVAGADIQEMNNMNEKQALEFSKMGQDLMNKIKDFKIPIIAAANGFALGGGCELSMACHIRYASENAVFGQPEVGLGLIAGWGGTQHLPRLIGRGRAMEILLSGQNINAKEAYSMGLVNKVVPIKELVPSVNKLAQKFIKNAPLAIAATINAINEGEIFSLNKGLLREQAEFSKLFNTKDLNEGISAFIEKRSPEFKGK